MDTDGASRRGGQRRRRPARRAGTVVWMLGAATIMGAATSYPVADRRRVRLDQAARDALVAEGKAQTFVQTSQGFLHVRVAGLETGQVVILAHGGVVGGQAFANLTKPQADAGLAAGRWIVSGSD
ncbi:MAG: hypothetical protein QOC69_4922 [Mycobacterium sp.]|nr:hypothetical protein [Mycobacterium sp.]